MEPGSINFGSETRPANFFRLAFSSIDEKRIEPGVKLLASLIHGQA
jgi:DNA-binding transcriptional MocR family regulator